QPFEQRLEYRCTCPGYMLRICGLEIRKEFLHPLILMNQLLEYGPAAKRNECSQLRCCKKILFFDLKVIGCDEIVATKIFVGVEKEDSFVECYQHPGDPEPTWRRDDKEVKVAVLVHVSF